ncbi:hypothetical protein ABFS83_14G147500 [Erythranthe nasuta]
MEKHHMMMNFYSPENISPSSASSSSSSEQDSRRVRKSSVFYSGEREFLIVDNDPPPPPPSPPPVSSVVSDTTSEEDVANCLMMLSRDKWNNNNREEYSGGIKVVKKSFKVRGGKYRCETCGRLFRSYQALGGHRASHKKARAAARGPHAPPRTVAREEAEVVVAEKVHECPFCPRVFSSGQALGGHKRTHYINGGKGKPPFSRSGEAFGIDLNMPAPSDGDDDDDEI